MEVKFHPSGDRIIIDMDPGQPIELDDLSGSFAALARMYQRHYRGPADDAPKLFVTRLETGSVIMEIAPLATFMGALAVMDNGIIVADFTNRLWRGIKAFSGGPQDAIRVEAPDKADAQDIREFAKPLLGKKGAELGIKHARYEKDDGKKRIVVEYKFDEAELNRAAINIDRELALPPPLDPALEKAPPSEAMLTEVMLFLEQAKRGPGKEKGRTGDRGVIPEISPKALPVYFRGSFQSLKDQMIRDVNPLTSTFVVDVYVQRIDGEPKGYVVTNVHQAIPGDDDG